MTASTAARLLALLLTLTLLAGAAPAQSEGRLADHVVLISIDGLRPEFYLDPSWPAPMLQFMAREGAHARGVQGVFPTVTYPSHTTIVTGALPSRHGVYYNTPFEPEGQTGRWYWEASSIRTPTLWDAVREAGMESAAVSWPVTVGAPITRVLPEVWSLDPDEPQLAPMRRATRPEGLWEEVEREATGRLGRRTYDPDHIDRDDTAGRIAAYLLETYRPALLAVHLLACDHFQHEQGRSGELVKRSVSAVDRAVAAIYEAAEAAGIAERTAFVITGDHGFVDIHTQLAPNVWLTQAGLREAASHRGDWQATFHAAGGAAFLQLREEGDEETLARVRRLLDELPAKHRRLFQVLGRDQLRQRGADPSVRLALAAEPGITFTSRADVPLLGPARQGGTHGYYPTLADIHTGLVGFGSGFRRGAAAPVVNLEDIAPLISRLLGLQLETPDGVVPERLLER